MNLKYDKILLVKEGSEYVFNNFNCGYVRINVFFNDPSTEEKNGRK